jgi:hypothetical protein
LGVCLAILIGFCGLSLVLIQPLLRQRMA